MIWQYRITDLDPDGIYDVEACDAEEAATEGAEHHWELHDGNECYDEGGTGPVIQVRPEGGDAWQSFAMRVDFCPSFYPVPIAGEAGQ